MIEQQLMGDMLPVTAIKTPPFIPEATETIVRVMREHGGTVETYEDHCVLTFPEGTVKQEIWPRMESTRYRVYFPDKYIIYETINRYGTSNLRFPIEEFPEEVIKKYQHLAL